MELWEVELVGVELEGVELKEVEREVEGVELEGVALVTIGTKPGPSEVITASHIVVTNYHLYTNALG